MKRARALTLTRRPDGIGVLTLDTPDGPVNVLSRELFTEMRDRLDEIEKDDAIRAVVLASGKSDNFIGGANVKQLLAITDAGEAEDFSRRGQALLDRIEESRKPFVAAIHGAALGGGLEIALACAYRLATDHPKTQLAQPEVMLGLLPGGGGTQRLPRLIGLERALPMLLTGQRLRAKQALRYGLVDALTSPGGLVETAAKAALALADRKLARADKKPAYTPILEIGPVRGIVLGKARTDVLKKTRGLYPAPIYILDCVEEGLKHSMARGLQKESELFGTLVASAGSKNLIRLFLAMTDLKKIPEAAPPRPVRKLGVLGAGFMGEGIASVSLGLNPVVLKDAFPDSLSRAARSLHRSLEKRVKSGSLAKAERDRQWSGLQLTLEASSVKACDLVIEAVFEDLDLKRKVLAETEALIAKDAVFASNTSALPIGAIARNAVHPGRVLGMHYFSPVPKMPLLEIVIGDATEEWAVATARAYGIAQGKTVIAVKDGPGFYTSRILAPYMNEAITLLEEGAEIAALDRALKDFGFPVGPVALLDEVGIDVAAHVSKDLGNAFKKRGLAPSETLHRLFEAGYKGRKNGKGFYRYTSDKKKEVNEEIYTFFGGVDRKELKSDVMVERLTLMMVNEAVHCLGEGILASARDGDAGAILGLGFPPFRGGPFRYVDETGIAEVVEKLAALAGTHGPRFKPAPLLLKMAKTGKRFHAE